MKAQIFSHGDPSVGIQGGQGSIDTGIEVEDDEREGHRAERLGRMDTNQIDAEIAKIDFLAEVSANGDGDGADDDKAAEDALLFRVLKAIAQGHPEPQSLAAYVIEECATKLRGRCCKDASEN